MSHCASAAAFADSIPMPEAAGAADAVSVVSVTGFAPASISVRPALVMVGSEPACASGGAA